MYFRVNTWFNNSRRYLSLHFINYLTADVITFLFLPKVRALEASSIRCCSLQTAKPLGTHKVQYWYSGWFSLGTVIYKKYECSRCTYLYSVDLEWRRILKTLLSLGPKELTYLLLKNHHHHPSHLKICLWGPSWLPLNWMS